MSDFVPANRPDLGSFHCDHSGGVAVKGDELDLVAPPIFVQVDHCSYIARFQSLSRKRSRQNHPVVLFDHDHFLSAGYAVTKRGQFRPRSIIQIVLTNGVLPIRLPIVPSRVYLIPWLDSKLSVTSVVIASSRKALAIASHSSLRNPSELKKAALPPLSGCAGFSR